MDVYDGDELDRPWIGFALCALIVGGTGYLAGQHVDTIGGEPPPLEVQAYRDCVRQTPPEALYHATCVAADPYTQGDDR